MLKNRLKKLEKQKQIKEEGIIDVVEVYSVDLCGTKELIKTIYPQNERLKNGND